MRFRWKCQESLKTAEYTLDQLIRLRCLEIYISLSNSNIDPSESSLKVIVLPSLVCPYFELDIIQAKDEMRKALLIKQGTEWIEWFCMVFLIHSICSNFNRGRDKVGVYYVRGVYFGPRGKIFEFNSFKSYWISIIFWYILQQTPTNVRTRSEFIFWAGGGKLVPRDFPLEN